MNRTPAERMQKSCRYLLLTVSVWMKVMGAKAIFLWIRFTIGRFQRFTLEDLIDINVCLICKFMIGLLLGPIDVFQGDNFWFLIMVRKF